MKLREYMASTDTDDGPLYFVGTESGKSCRDVYYAHRAGDYSRVFRWEDGKAVIFDEEAEVEPLSLPPRPMPLDESWLTCGDTTIYEMRTVIRRYSRKVEMWMDAALKKMVI